MCGAGRDDGRSGVLLRVVVAIGTRNIHRLLGNFLGHRIRLYFAFLFLLPVA